MKNSSMRAASFFCPMAGTCANTCLAYTGKSAMNFPVNVDSREWILPPQYRQYRQGETTEKPVPALLTTGNPKLDKTGSAGLALLPSTRFRDLLKSSPRIFANSQERARFYRAALFMFQEETFVESLAAEIEKLGNVPVRLNVYSDISWESLGRGEKPFLSLFPKRRYYDYTKLAHRVIDARCYDYSLAYSVSERTTHNDLVMLHAMGGRIAVTADSVEAARYLVQSGGVTYRGRTWSTVDADESDSWIWESDPLTAGIATPKGTLRKNPNAFSLAWKRFFVPMED